MPRTRSRTTWSTTTRTARPTCTRRPTRPTSRCGSASRLLGSAPNAFNANPNPAGLEANRAPIVVQRLQTDVSVWRFKAEVMAMVRSIEQQYWALVAGPGAVLGQRDRRGPGRADPPPRRGQVPRRQRGPAQRGRGRRAARTVPPGLRGQDGQPHHRRAAAPQHPRPAADRQPPDRARSPPQPRPAWSRTGRPASPRWSPSSPTSSRTSS